MSWPWYVNLAALVLVIVAPIWLGRSLARQWRMPDYAFKFAFILFTLFAGVVISYYGWSTDHIQLGIDLKGGSYLVYQVLGSEVAVDETTGQPTTVGTRSGGDPDKLVAALRRRVDPSGVLGVKIRAYGSKQIEIKVPQVDPLQVEHLKRMIADVGTLEFRILATDQRIGSPNFRAFIQQAKALPLDQTQLWEPAKGDQPARLLAWWVPVTAKQEDEFRDPHYGTREITNRKGVKRLEVLVVNDIWNVTGQYLTRATPSVDNVGRPCVNFAFDSTGAAKFGRMTGFYSPDTVQKFKYNLAIILNKELFTAPSLNSVIFDRGEITGGFTQERAKELVDVLNAGALPATLSPQPISERTTGPELGQDTIRSGKLSMIVALASVFIFVLIYYRFAGMVACLTLTMNSILLLACMIVINAEFSLAGIAGFALSVGMGVDANVLIYERMREEAARGAALRMTIRNGFERALSAIIDSNLTTLITAAILYAIGSDQVRGFAVTLFLGISLSLFTAIIVGRVIFDVAERRKWISRVKMLRALPPTHFDFLRYKWLMVGISLAIITIGLVATIVRGSGLLDIDFTGGVSVEAVFNGSPDVKEVRDKLERAPEAQQLPDVTVRDVKEGAESRTKTFIIDASNPSGENPEQYRETVKKNLEGIFGSELSRNHMTFSAPIPLAGQFFPSPAFAEGSGSLVPSPVAGEGSGVRAAARPELAGLSAALLGQASPATPPVAGESKTPAENPAPEKPVAEKPVAEKPVAEKPVAEKPVAEKPVAEKPVAEKPVAEKPVAEKPAAGKPPAPSDSEPAGPKPPASIPSLPKTPSNPFAGGTQATLTFDQKIDHATVENLFTKVLQAQLKDKRVDVELTNPDFEEGSLGRFTIWDVKIKLPSPQAEPIFKAVAAELESQPFFPSSDTIGGEVAKQTRTHALFALAASTFFILLYLWVRFQRIAFGVGAVASLIHDVLIALAFVAISYYVATPLGFLGVEPFKINVIMMTAFLTLAGYSLNDTIVIFDRIRETRGKSPQVTEAMINASINQCLGRTILTGWSTLMVILTLYILGGPTIHGFAFAMGIGVVTGMYSSVYIAAPLLLWLSRKTEKQRGRG